VASDWEGVSVGSGNLLTAAPTWTRLDAGITGLRCSGISIQRGRSSVFERTGTGTCTATFNDRVGYLDPTNAASLISKPFAVAIRNPVSDEWHPLFRGIVDDAGFVLNKHTLKLETAIQAVDLFDAFSNFELIPGLAGFVNAQINSAGYVFYEDAGFDERVLAILGDFGLPSQLYSVFTGNIICRESTYAAGDKVMQALEEAVDAEFPTVANHYVDKRGRYQVHGRYARFDPDTVSASASNWDFERWEVGDNAAARADTGKAKMQEPYGFSESRADIRNAALCFPEGVDQSDLEDFIYADATSRAAHGTRTWTAPNLQVEEETTLGMTGKEFCQLVSEYIVENYKNPIPRIPQVTVGTERPGGPDVFGPAAWAYMCGVDISDVVNVAIGHPGGGGFATDHYVEGIRIHIHPGPGSLDNSFPFIKHTADLSSVDHWASNPFGAVP
jgi:hypothetical protein